MELMSFSDPVRPSTVNFESNGATSVLEVGTSGSGSSPGKRFSIFFFMLLELTLYDVSNFKLTNSYKIAHLSFQKCSKFLSDLPTDRTKWLLECK